MIKRNLILLDFETDGLDFDEGQCEPVQVYADAINYWDLTDHHAGSFHALIKPYRPEKAQAGALKVIGDGWAKANKEGLDKKVVFSKLIDYCKEVQGSNSAANKPIIIAWNQNFDRGVFEATLKELNLVKKGAFGYDWPWAWMFDAMQMFYQMVDVKSDIDSLKLDTALEFFQMKRSGATHDAKEDVELMKQMVIRMIRFNRACQKHLKIASTYEAPRAVPNLNQTEK